jgi:hypothetical protein
MEYLQLFAAISEAISDGTVGLIMKNSYDMVFAFAVVIGMLGHYCKKKVKNETTSSVVGWFSYSNIQSSIATLVAILVAITGAISNNLITPDMGIMTIIYTGLTTGFAVDSATNTD